MGITGPVSDKRTDEMQTFDAAQRDRPRGRGGLVLLYAGEYAALPAAYALGAGGAVIGRDPSADIVLPVSAVSRRHAEVTRAGDDYVVRDLGSRNGVLVNGHPVTETVLEPLDELRIGDAILKLVEEGVDDYAGYRIDGAVVGSRGRRAPASNVLVGGWQMDRILGELHRVARAPLNVLLLGASGTGKEVVASELHRLSGRDGRFAAVNCAAIPGNLLESELFGHLRGAFTGADRDRKGLFREAEGGTILLDEIGEMPTKMQAGLLRVLQEKMVRPVGGVKEEPVDARVITATNRDLEQMVATGSFRDDLFYRLHVVEIRVPSLRERNDDVPPLIDHFLTLFSARYRRDKKTISRDALRRLVAYDWPGNVRQLEHVLLNAWLMSEGAEIQPDDLQLQDPPRAVQGEVSSIRPSQAPVPVARTKEEFKDTERERILSALSSCNWNRVQAAKMIGIPRRTFYRRLKEYGIL